MPRTAFGIRQAAAEVPRVTLTPLGQVLANAMAAARLAYYASLPNIRNRVWKLDWERNERDAAGAEVAFCTLANVLPDLSEWGTGRKTMADCTLADGRRVDVKNTDRPEGHLIVPDWHRRGRVDLYTLMVGAFPGPYLYRGYATSGLVFRQENRRPDGKGWWLPQDALCRLLPLQ